ncbi:RES family NAD+ phosphorylase [Polynucleobacter kasalickyi]|uniref:RES domain-containing protein n=1 Tax=Polynucleobacter kasalickyi TaxID=1938817 RepID=A0A1W2BP83_9BURK|nr:RES family NAD+ phosphorylase [Polynucleobacter kasalickyi]SMC74482.1 RES domain-containing protein [Polynucleobacter kasalickyi]
MPLHMAAQLNGLWLIAKKKYALGRIGVGAMKTGGRWNSINIPIIYTGMSVEIAALEKLVHM